MPTNFTRLEALRVQNITKKFIGHVALDDVSASVPQGSIYGLLGPNGAGKTTLIRIVTQIIMADEGEVFLGDRRIAPQDILRIGYLPEERGLYKKMKVGEQLLYLARLKGVPKSDAIKKIRLWLKKLDLESWWNKNVQDLSKGMQQKIQFIATIMADPELIILDEPFSGFDPINANAIKDEILELREKGATIIFSTHRMESVEELCDHIALINKSKKILEGTKEDIKNSYRTNTFIVEYNNDLTELPAAFDLQSTVRKNGSLVSEIAINNGDSGNDLLKHLIDKVEVVAFNEKVPTMNEIFISKVGGEHE